MIHNNDIEEEIDVIRDKLYTTINGMSTDERVKYINTRAREIMIEQGIVTDSRKLKPISTK